MKKVFGILLIVVGLISFVKCISPSVPETIGAFIGLVLFIFLPAYFLLRGSKKDKK